MTDYQASRPASVRGYRARRALWALPILCCLLRIGGPLSLNTLNTASAATSTSTQAIINYSYDGAGRLVSTTYADGTVVSYTLDSAGNRTAVTPGTVSTIEFSQTSYSVNNTAGSVSLSVGRINGTIGNVTVTYSTSNGSATANQQYVATTNQLSWAAGDSTSRTISVPILNTNSYGPNTTFTVTLSQANGAVLANPVATVTIVNTNPVVQPHPPSALTTTTVAPNSVGLSWTAPSAPADPGGPGIASYNVLRGGVVIGNPAGTTYSDSGVAPSGTYAYSVQSVDSLGTASAAIPAGGLSVTTPSTFQITDDSGNVIPAAAALYSSSTACNQPLNTCLWTLVTKYGTPVTVWSIRSGMPYMPCPPTQIAPLSSGAIGYSQPSSTSCQIRATPAAYGQPPITPKPGTVALSNSSYGVLDNAGSVSITLTRTGGADGAVSVAYSTSNGTAAAGTQYQGTSGVLSWADQDATNKTVTVPITYTGVWSQSLTFSISLSNPSGNPAPVLGTATATVTITYSEPGTLEFTKSNYPVNVTDGVASLSVARVNGGYGTVGVSYATADGTARAGSDYTAEASQLSWGNGVTSNTTISIPITNSGIAGPNKTFTVSLSAATGGATIAAGSATVTINNNNPIIYPSTPSGLTESSATPTQVSLAWGASSDTGGPGLAGYHVYRNGTQIAPVTTTAYTDTNVAAGNSYSYSVTAYDVQGNESPQSNTISVTVPSTYQITDTSGNVLSTAAGLYATSTTCSSLLNTCEWKLSTTYGVDTVVFAIVGVSPNLQHPCTSGKTLIDISGYSRPDGVSCQITATPSVYGH